MEWFRDLVICVSGVVAIAFFILISILSYSFYQRTKRIMDSAEITSTAIHGITSDIRDEINDVKEEIVSPMVQVMAVIRGVRQGVELVNKLFDKDKGEKNG